MKRCATCGAPLEGPILGGRAYCGPECWPSWRRRAQGEGDTTIPRADVSLPHEERQHFIIPWLGWQARRDRPDSRKRSAGTAQVLAAAGVDPEWTSEEFHGWRKGGE